MKRHGEKVLVIHHFSEVAQTFVINKVERDRIAVERSYKLTLSRFGTASGQAESRAAFDNRRQLEHDEIKQLPDKMEGLPATLRSYHLK